MDKAAMHMILFIWLQGEKMIDDDPLMLFGLRLTELRKAKGWSQEWMALESGLARSYVSGIERGQRNLSLLNICRLAEALEVEPSALLKPPKPPKAVKPAKPKPKPKPKSKPKKR
jgi:transcriptional regulator with XRE-family HTH domain